MSSKKKQKDLFGDVSAKDKKKMHGKPKRKQLMLEILEMNKQIIKDRHKNALTI